MRPPHVARHPLFCPTVLSRPPAHGARVWGCGPLEGHSGAVLPCVSESPRRCRVSTFGGAHSADVER